MAYDLQLAERVRTYLKNIAEISFTETKMFRGLAFMVQEKMCVNISGENLMCRFDPEITDQISSKPGYSSMVMNGKNYKGFCYVAPSGIQSDEELKFWLELSLDFNPRAKASKPRKKK